MGLLSQLASEDSAIVKGIRLSAKNTILKEYGKWPRFAQDIGSFIQNQYVEKGFPITYYLPDTKIATTNPIETTYLTAMQRYLSTRAEFCFSFHGEYHEDVSRLSWAMALRQYGGLEGIGQFQRDCEISIERDAHKVFRDDTIPPMQMFFKKAIELQCAFMRRSLLRFPYQ